ncbi:Cof-type HAD-IIB family hydrolase [Cellulomonas sp. P24]|uniref:Cof-type HAD-IIB family hydrolase n=1 Tax=Cellulomonas sp. P24 TaxID=2885206 RepID=UPI00216B5F50|nr:Cof-type HAD-IIB family hydrolase [Cellulomonas sp. P24]MCR6494321.1 Cof-type HAD-IIB family hydrolase [Cellulomonas sp. P24]
MTRPLSPAPISPPVFDPTPDIRLIAADMDGTLLDDDDELHEHVWPLIDELHRRGIVFCPASGRQYDNLRARFAEVAGSVVFIAENGAYVVRDGHEVSSDGLDLGVVGRLVETARDLAAQGADIGVVVCGKRAAHIERNDAPFREEVDKYYLSLEVVEDLTQVDDEVLKVAVYDFGSAEETTAPAFEAFRATQQVVVSGRHWLDVMSPTANKGEGIRALQRALGVTPAQTMVFGDFLNDLEMMDAADYSFAMDNAHPRLRERARYVAPSNAENGVVRTISSVLGLTWST